MIFHITPDAIVYSDDRGSDSVAPFGPVTDPRFLLGMIEFRIGQGEATLVLDEPLDWSEAADTGWQAQGMVSHWRHFTKKNAGRINVVTIADRADDANDPMTLGPWENDLLEPELRKRASALDVASKLTAWWRQTGTHYYATPGVSAVRNLRASFDDAPNQPVWRLIDMNTAAPWRPPTGQLAALEHTSCKTRRTTALHMWDMRGAYLAAMSAVTLPFRQLRHTGYEPSTWDCGYYRVSTLGINLPAWFWPNIDAQGTSWITQGTARLLGELGHTPELVDSWTPRGRTDELSGHRRILRHWAEDWRDTFLADPAPLKAGYAQLVGLMTVASGQIYRPDWRHMIIDQVRASVLRRVIRVHSETGVWPVRISTDAVYYRSSLVDSTSRVDLDAGAVGLFSGLLGVGQNIGNMRYEGVTYAD